MRIFLLLAGLAVSASKISLDNALSSFSQRFTQLQLARYDNKNFLKKKIRKIAKKVQKKKVIYSLVEFKVHVVAVFS